MKVPTVKIKADTKLGYMTINKEDFDASKDKLSLSIEEPAKEIVKETPATVEVIKVGDKIEIPKEQKKKPGRPPLNKKENPFD